MDNSYNNNIEAWQIFLELIGERYLTCMDSEDDIDIALRNAIVELLADACR